MKRSKRLGLFVGVVGGLSLTIGAPLGAVISTLLHPSVPFLISPFIFASCVLLLLFIPVDDTLGIKSETRTRQLPDWGEFFISHFPVSHGSVNLVMAATRPLDWLTNLLMHCCTSLASMILIQYCLAVIGWSALRATASVLSVGLCLGIFAPILTHRYDPLSLAFYTMGMFTLGLGFLAMSGSGIGAKSWLCSLGVACMALGASFVPSLQTGITFQYPRNVLGRLHTLILGVSLFNVLYVTCWQGL
jgi:hypothetical protein